MREILAVDPGDPVRQGWPVIGHTASGRPIYEIAGGDGSAEGAGGGTDPGSGEPSAGSSGGSQGAAGSGGEGGQQGQGGSQGDPGGHGQQGGTSSSQGGRTDALAIAREEAIAERKKRQEFEERVKKLEDEKLSDTERREKRTQELEAKNAQLEERLRQREMADAFEAAGRKAGARVPRDVWRLVETGDVEFDDKTGRITNADKLVGKLKTARPEHFLPAGGRGTADGGPRPPAPQGEDMNSMIRRMAGRPG